MDSQKSPFCRSKGGKSHQNASGPGPECSGYLMGLALCLGESGPQASPASPYCGMQTTLTFWKDLDSESKASPGEIKILG